MTDSAHNQHDPERGQVIVIVVLSLVVLLGMAAFVIDLGNFRAHRRQMQTAADAAALAGAMQLPPFSDGSTSCARAEYYEHQNTDATDDNNLIVDGNLDTSYCELLANSVRVKPVENDVPYVFGRVLGFVNTDVEARARARVVYLTRSEGLLPFGVEDLRPNTVTVFLGSDPNNPVQQWPLGLAGCQGPTVEGYPYWCTPGNVHINSLPAGGLPVGIKVVDNSNKTIVWTMIGYVGSPQTIPGTSECAGPCVVDNAILNPNTQPYYHSSSTGGQIVVQVHFATAPVGSSNAPRIKYGSNNYSAATSLGGNWYEASFPRETTESPAGQDVFVRIGNGGNAPATTQPVLHTYARDDGDILQQFTQSAHFLPTTGGDLSFQAAFQVLVKGKIITLKLGGGGAQGNSGNYQGLDLDTNTSWPIYQCYSQAGVPNAADEVQHGSCTPYSLGDSVDTQTGNFAGQVNNGLQARIGTSPNQWTDVFNPPAFGDPRWMSLILVPPVTFSQCNGTCTTTVIGFGSFYITEWSGQQGSTLKQGEVRGVFWDRPVKINQYSTTCDDPQNICLASVALMPWDG